LSENGSRPAHLEEFARKLSAAAAEQAEAGKRRFGLGRPSVKVDVSSSQSDGEAIAPGSKGNDQPAEAHRPSTETRKTWPQFSSPELKRDSPQGDSAHEPAKASASATGDLYRTQRGARLSNLTEASCAARELKSPTRPAASSAIRIGISNKLTRAAANHASPAIAQAFPQANGNGPRQEIGPAPVSVDSKARYAVDFDKLLADTEAFPANDPEVEQAFESTDLRARLIAEALKQFSGGWKQMPLAYASVSVVVVCTILLAYSLLAVSKTPPESRETITRDESAQEALKARPLESSPPAEDRSGVDSGGIGATVSAAKANETQRTDGTRATNRTINGAPPGLTPDASDPTRLTSSLALPGQLSKVKSAAADLTAVAPSANTPGIQTSESEPASPDPTTTATSSASVQPSGFQPAPTASPPPPPTSGLFPTGRSPADHARRQRESAGSARNVDEVGKLLAREGDVPAKIVGKPSIGATVTKNTAASAPLLTGKSSQSAVGKEATPSNAVQSPSTPSVDPDASNRPTYAVGRGGVEARYPSSDASEQRPLLRAISDAFGKGTASVQHSAGSIDPSPRAE
jgi:hypothetical protein